MTSESIFRGHHFYYTEELYILNPYFFTHLPTQDNNIYKIPLILVIKHNSLTHQLLHRKSIGQQWSPTEALLVSRQVIFRKLRTFYKKVTEFL